MASNADSAALDAPQVKTCRKCSTEKPLSEFVADKRARDGVGGRCKSCHKSANAKWRSENPAKQKLCETRWKSENVNARRAYGVEYFRLNKAEQAARVRRYRENNPHKVAQFNRASHAKRSANPKYRVEASVRAAIHKTISRGEKSKRTFDALGYTPEELMAHIERQFQPGMNWDNYGDWHIDHKTPLSAHSYTTYECHDFRKAWALSNLQPLWAIHNLSKGAKLLPELSKSRQETAR